MSKKCLGCGIELQSDDELKDGYVLDIEHDICQRCFVIKNYGQNRDILKSNLDYMAILNGIKDDDLVVYVSSLLTLNLDYLDKFKRVVLVLTKRDILPKSVKDEKIVAYIKKRYPNVLDIVIVSAYKKYNLDCLYNKLEKHGNKRDIYFVGITNSGKSTLINKMIECYSNKPGKITMSNYPSTTLGIVKEEIGELKIKDTPGIVIEDSVINYLDDLGIKKINSKKEIKPITMQIKGNGVILVDEIIRIEYETKESSMTFYVSNNLSVDSISYKNPRLKDGKMISYVIDNNQDMVIEDVGFIKCTKKCTMKIIYKDNISIRIRDNLI